MWANKINVKIRDERIGRYLPYVYILNILYVIFWPGDGLIGPRRSKRPIFISWITLYNSNKCSGELVSEIV